MPIINTIGLLFKNESWALLVIYLLMMTSCGGGTDVKKNIVNSNSQKTITSFQKEESKSIVNSQDTSLEEWYQINPQFKPISISRKPYGKKVTFQIDPMHTGGEAWTTVFEESVEDPSLERSNRVCQLSPTVILYRRFPSEVAKNFYHIDQPETIEFFDSMYNTVKVVDIWKNHPYKSFGKKLTYYNFDTEEMEVIPYKDQEKKEIANEFSMFTEVISEGNHVIVNYQLRSLNSNYQMIGVKHTLKIFDLSGNLKYELKDLPSVDGAVVSNNGGYMMYTFGGRGLRTANDPFGTIDREGWALMRLKDQKVVYKEFTDDGTLAIQGGGGRLIHDLLCVSYSTPDDKDGVFDYYVFFDEHNNSIYKKVWTHEEWSLLSNEWKTTENKNWKYFIKKFNFQQISIEKN